MPEQGPPPLPTSNEDEMSWLDKQFANTSMVIIVLFALFGCCAPVILPLSLVGLIACRDPTARRNAAILFFCQLGWVVIGVLVKSNQVSRF